MPSLATSLLLLKGISPSSGQKDAIISGDIVDTVTIPEGLRVSKGFGTRGYNTVRLSVSLCLVLLFSLMFIKFL